MKRAFYDAKPPKYEAVGNGSYLYRWDIQEEVIKDEMTSSSDENDEPSERVQYSCFEVEVWSPVSSNSILQAVLEAKFPNGREQKYINEYNAAILGVYSEAEAAEKVEAYKVFLTERNAVKAQVDADCKALGIR